MAKPSVKDVMSKGPQPALSLTDPVEDPMADAAPSPEEVDAMQMFSVATSPEQKAEALKAFLKACGVY